MKVLRSRITKNLAKKKFSQEDLELIALSFNLMNQMINKLTLTIISMAKSNSKNNNQSCQALYSVKQDKI